MKAARRRVLKEEKKERDFLRSRLITQGRDDEIERQANTFGTDGHADRVVEGLVAELDTGAADSDDGGY